MTTTFEKELVAEVVKHAITPEKIQSLANKMGPKIEKSIENTLTRYIEDYLSDTIYDSDAIRDMMFDAVENVARGIFKIPAPTKKVTKRR